MKRRTIRNLSVNRDEISEVKRKNKRNCQFSFSCTECGGIATCEEKIAQKEGKKQ